MAAVLQHELLGPREGGRAAAGEQLRGRGDEDLARGRQGDMKTESGGALVAEGMPWSQWRAMGSHALAWMVSELLMWV